jgi:hypothetical protein
MIVLRVQEMRDKLRIWWLRPALDRCTSESQRTEILKRRQRNYIHINKEGIHISINEGHTFCRLCLGTVLIIKPTCKFLDIFCIKGDKVYRAYKAIYG